MNFSIIDWESAYGTGTISKDEASQTEMICQISDKISSIYLWILFAIGFPGNVLTIITTVTMQLVSPATFFVALLAAFDGAALVAKLIFQQIYLHKVPISDFGCKTEFIATYLATVANWILVLICAERFVSVCYPLKKISWITKRRSYIAAIVVAIFILVLYGSLTIPMRTSGINTCGTKVDYGYFWINYWYWINATCFLFLPILFILIFTVGIIRGLYISRRDRRNLLEKGSSREGVHESITRNNSRLVAETERIERAITFMMILAAVLFLALALPAFVYHIVQERHILNSGCMMGTSQAYREMFKQIQNVLVDATHAINFFIYFFAAKRFRDQLIKLLKCKCRKKEHFRKNYQNTYSTQLSTSSKLNLSVIPQTPAK